MQMDRERLAIEGGLDDTVAYEMCSPLCGGEGARHN
jgi:hypothetical protein